MFITIAWEYIRLPFADIVGTTPKMMSAKATSFNKLWRDAREGFVAVIAM
jgi:hypothetical protein